MFASSNKYELYQVPSQWVVASWWYWKKTGAPDAEGHGPFPTKGLAKLAGWLSTL